MKRVLVLDNYDSFTYNLVHLLEKLGLKDVSVLRNDKCDLSEVAKFDKILLSPGPGIPSEAGLMTKIVNEFASNKSILGVCLGHQCIAENFGAKLVNMPLPVHGKTSQIIVVDQEEKLFFNLPKQISVGRYHSWMVSKVDLPSSILPTALDQDGNIMALRHDKYDVRGVQFHPESVMTDHGAEMIKNWIGD